MTTTNKKHLSEPEQETLLSALKARFHKNQHRHGALSWAEIEARLTANPAKLWSLGEMEATGGEPDVIGLDSQTGEYLFCDCSAESPKGRRSLCYDHSARVSRKEFPPENSALEMASEMGIKVLNEEEYRTLQHFGPFDTKTSSWVETPPEMRGHGGALFGDHRYGRVFFYHNGAQSYYAARGFRGLLRV